ncbi:MAG: deoxyribodipyrimidine photo-lyase, partial [Pseudomonadota bacterium]|nr:deoxyribodipyrimidine photo-lyase [Pseudomonadota bacterium]
MQKTTQVLWLRNDLRLHDHEGFRLAVEYGAPLAVIYILPEHWLNTDDDGMSRLGSAKAHFLRASLIDLHRQLEDQTINFNMYHGHPVDIITRLRDELCGDIRLLTSDAQAPEEQEWLEAIKGYDIDLVTYESQTLFSSAQMDSLLNNFPASFSKFRKTVEKWSDRFAIPESKDAARLLIHEQPLRTSASISWPGSDYSVSLGCHGGERPGIEWLSRYVWDDKAITHY